MANECDRVPRAKLDFVQKYNSELPSCRVRTAIKRSISRLIREGDSRSRAIEIQTGQMCLGYMVQIDAAA